MPGARLTVKAPLRPVRRLPPPGGADTVIPGSSGRSMSSLLEARGSAKRRVWSWLVGTQSTGRAVRITDWRPETGAPAITPMFGAGVDVAVGVRVAVGQAFVPPPTNVAQVPQAYCTVSE